MATTTMVHNATLDWFRVGAWSGSLAAHIGILLLIALPMTLPSTRPPVTTVVARWIESNPPPPALPEPPPPSVPRRVRPTPVHATPSPVIPVDAATDAPSQPIPAADTPTTADASTSVPATPGDDIGGGGATQTLAYATPLQPPYPPASARAREQGTVMLRVLVDPSGVPQRVEIARSSGHARLDAAARDSVMRARFRPVMRNGEAASAWGLVPIEFRLDRG
jgi:protein TonB